MPVGEWKEFSTRRLSHPGRLNSKVQHDRRLSCRSVREWRQYYRHLQYQKAAQKRQLQVNWERYHLAVLFVDRTDIVRARVAAGIFDRIANWNGFGRALYPSTAGVQATGESPGLTTSAGLMAQAGLLKIPPKLFSRPGAPFELEDLDRNDFILALDQQTKQELERILCQGLEDCTETLSKVALLTDFKDYLSPLALTKSGGTAVLESELRQILEPALGEAQAVVDIERPTLTQGAGEWNRMVQCIICSCAGLVQFLVDAWPPDLPDYDPL